MVTLEGGGKGFGFVVRVLGIYMKFERASGCTADAVIKDAAMKTRTCKKQDIETDCREAVRLQLTTVS